MDQKEKVRDYLAKIQVSGDHLMSLINDVLDMSRIESRPVIGKPWEYSFYIDLLGQWNDEAFIECLKQVREVTEDFRVLGAYEAAERNTL